jgi:PPOX class probable F420-dependent enzyme
MPLTDQQRAFVEQHRAAAMITLGAHGTPHAVRVGVALVDGKLQSSGTQDRARTKHLRRDPRATLFLFEQGFGYLTLESRVTILEDPDVPQKSLRLFQTMQAGMEVPEGSVMWNGKPMPIDDFLKVMVEEKRLIYEFEVQRAYGL